MTDSAQITPPVEAKPTEKELNFRALEAKYQRQLEQERAARLEAERKIQEAMQLPSRNPHYFARSCSPDAL